MPRGAGVVLYDGKPAVSGESRTRTRPASPSWRRSAPNATASRASRPKRSSGKGSSYRSDDDYVFSHPRRGSKLEAHWYADEFKAALAAAGVVGRVRTFHDMRHTALTNLAASGASPVALMATAGHRSMSTTKQYVHLAGVVFRDETAALERRLLGLESSSHLS